MTKPKIIYSSWGFYMYMWSWPVVGGEPLRLKGLKEISTVRASRICNSLQIVVYWVLSTEIFKRSHAGICLVCRKSHKSYRLVLMDLCLFITWSFSDVELDRKWAETWPMRFNVGKCNCTSSGQNLWGKIFNRWVCSSRIRDGKGFGGLG